MKQPFNKKTYYVLTLDPVHVGTGGYRLGRVDNTITREPGNNLPKIPGSSLSGVTRTYTAMAIQSENSMVPKKQKYIRIRYDKDQNPIIKRDEDGNQLMNSYGQPVYEYESCAGKGTDDGEGHCGQPDCPVCVTFGFSKGKTGSSFQGLAQFFDIRILFFPLHSMIGPVWVTCPSVLESVGIQPSGENMLEEWTQLNGQLSKIGENNKQEEYFCTTSPLVKEYLNLGWIYLSKKTVKFKEQDLPDAKTWSGKATNSTFKTLQELGMSSQILERLVLVSDSLFPRIVNDNLEVRTSVAIDPVTGAAEEGALFTYEAIPRATVMWFDVVYNKPEYFHIKALEGDGSGFVEQEIQHGKVSGQGWAWVRENVEKGLALIEHMGIGGMGTRGMGRVRILNRENALP
jgi:CRISPR-associated protein Cmr4